jgi:hypothetical protein
MWDPASERRVFVLGHWSLDHVDVDMNLNVDSAMSGIRTAESFPTGLEVSRDLIRMKYG